MWELERYHDSFRPENPGLIAPNAGLAVWGRSLWDFNWWFLW